MLDEMTASTLQQAVAAAQSGNLPHARELASTALAKGGDVTALNAFLGMINAREGDLVAASRNLQIAHKARPDDITIACNLLSVLIDSQQWEGALAVATRELAFSDESLRIIRYRGFVAQSLEKFEEAAEAYQYVVEKAPDDFESWNNLGNALRFLGDLDGSIAALRRAFELDSGTAPTRVNLAAALMDAEHYTEAEDILTQAVDDFPGQSSIHHQLYILYKVLERHMEALAQLERAVALDPASAVMQFKLAVEYGIMSKTDEAEKAYLGALDADPMMTDAYLGLAIQYEHTNRDEEFAPLMARAEAAGVAEGVIAFLRAYDHRRAGRFEEGLVSLDAVPEDIEPIRVAHLKATMLDRLGRPKEAFISFAETARLHQEDPSEPLQRAIEERQRLRDELDLMTPEWVAGWSQPAVPSSQPSPVFLVGFPRSGTTLLDTFLMGHDQTFVMEERPALNLVDQQLGGLAALADMDAQAIAQARDHYFDNVRKAEGDVGNKLLIDKSPLFLQKLPLIQRLFPDAKFILALRHPCDVLLSCFMSNFRLNSAMANFLKLEDAADYYDLTFQHWERSLALFPTNVHTIFYEKLVDDVEEHVRPLFDFLDLEWDDNVLDHITTAKSRGLITTASYSQVTEPVYKRSSGRWQKYRDDLKPIFPAIAPWADKFGYSLDAPE